MKMRNVICSMVLALPILAFAQSPDVLESNFEAQTGKALVASSNVKHLRASSKRIGRVVLDTTKSNYPIPDSLFTALKIARDIWSDYIGDGEVRIGVNFDNLSKDVSVGTYYDVYQGFSYPQSLIYKLTGNDRMYGNDAIISINKNCNWGVGNGMASEKNLTYTMLQAIAATLGFGSSVKYDTRKNVVLPLREISIFDSLIKAEDNTPLSSLKTSASIRNFAQGGNGDVYVYASGSSYKLYSPPTYNEDKSLKFLDKQNTLMNYTFNDNIDFAIDSSTINILNSLGWNYNSDEQITIIGENIPETGITSAYKTNTFYIQSNGKDITGFDWKLEFPLEDNTFDTYCTSTQQQFSIPALSNINKYCHTSEGDIKGIVVFSGLIDGEPVECKYGVTFELEPLVLKAEIIDKTPCDYDDTYYDALLNIYYSGSHYVHVNLVENGSSNVNTYFSDRPFYTQIRLRDIDSWETATVNIIIRNEYGQTNYKILLPGCFEKSPEKLPDIEINNSLKSDIEQTDVYNLNGTYKTSYSTIDDLNSLGKGVYILKYIGKNQEVLITKKIVK